MEISTTATVCPLKAARDEGVWLGIPFVGEQLLRGQRRAQHPSDQIINLALASLGNNSSMRPNIWIRRNTSIANSRQT
jgi:hypothetical protein